jgi:alanine-synthesizing transaminase
VHFSDLADEMAGVKNPLYVLRDSIRAEGATIIDLVQGNVNEHGIAFPQETLQQILVEAAEPAQIYRPDSLGQYAARTAIADYYAGLSITPEQIVVTPGTSISYWYCFKLLAGPGDEILCPQPSYPLFEYIARISGVQMTHYRLVEARHWAIDLDYLENQITTRTRAIIVISPHNPTGAVAADRQLEGLADIAARHDLPIVSDEVFSEFLFGPEKLPRAAATKAPLVFTLNGFSKMFALPGIKIGWMAVSGDTALVRKAMATLEMISDTFLPANEIVQFAVPAIFSRGQAFLQDYKAWVSNCHDLAITNLADVDFVRPAGGFYVTVPTFEEEDEAAGGLLRDHGILTHPGYYYDIKPNHLVMTFIHNPRLLAKTFRRISNAVRLHSGA